MLLHHFRTGWINLKLRSCYKVTAFNPNLSQLDNFMIKHTDDTQRQIKVFHIYSDTCCLFLKKNFILMMSQFNNFLSTWVRGTS